MHERMKDLAGERGLRWPISTRWPSRRSFEMSWRPTGICRPNGDVHITIEAPSGFASMVRQAARDRCFSPNELIYTTVRQKLDVLSEPRVHSRIRATSGRVSPIAGAFGRFRSESHELPESHKKQQPRTRRYFW